MKRQQLLSFKSKFHHPPFYYYLLSTWRVKNHIFLHRVCFNCISSQTSDPQQKIHLHMGHTRKKSMSRLAIYEGCLLQANVAQPSGWRKDASRITPSVPAPRTRRSLWDPRTPGESIFRKQCGEVENIIELLNTFCFLKVISVCA